jgi:hypothetical protein
VEVEGDAVLGDHEAQVEGKGQVEMAAFYVGLVDVDRLCLLVWLSSPGRFVEQTALLTGKVLSEKVFFHYFRFF